MRVAIDISQIVYEGTGVANYTLELVRNLLMLDRANEYLLFGATIRQRALLQSYFTTFAKLNRKVQTKWLPLPNRANTYIWNYFHKIPIETIIGACDVFHSSDWIQPPSRAKKVTTLHDMIIYKYPQISHPYIVETHKQRLFWVQKECDVILADSETTRYDGIDILKLAPAKVRVVHPGIGEEFTRGSAKEIERIKHKYSLLDDFIFFVGTQEPRKNLKKLVGAFERFLSHPLIMSRKNPVELIIAGNVGWGQQVKGVKRVRMLGYIPKEELPFIYSAATMFVYPSLYEGFGLPIVEAFSCGCPVITSDRGSLKEVAGDAAILIDPNSEDDISAKMVQLIIDETLRKELRVKGKIQAKKFTWEKSAHEVLKIYKEVASI